MAPNERTSKRQKLSPVENKSTGNDSDSTADTATGSRDAGKNRSSWYSGTWPRKSVPVTQVARESISSASNTALETASALKDKITTTNTPSRRSSLALTLGKTKPSKALPVQATISEGNAMSHGQWQDKEQQQEDQSRKVVGVSAEARTRPAAKDLNTSNTGSSVETDAQEAGSDVEAVHKSPHGQQTSVPAAPRSWIGWLAGGDGTQTNAQPSLDTQPADPSSEASSSGKKVDSQAAEQSVSTDVKASLVAGAETATVPKPSVTSHDPSQRRSWLPLWNNATAAQSAPAISSPSEVMAEPPRPDPAAEIVNTANKPVDQPEIKTNEPLTVSPIQAAGVQKPSAWIFWSRDKSSETQSLKDAPREGEIAISDTRTENRPRRTSIDIKQKPASENKPPVEVPKEATVKVNKFLDSVKNPPASASKSHTTKAENKSATATAIGPKDIEVSRPPSPAPSKKAYEHLLLPKLDETLKIPEDPSLLQRLARLFYVTSDTDLKHLNRVRDPPRIKNALAIGVHGYFPAPLIQSVLGRPTGTSIKFADMAAKSIRRYTKGQGYECSIKTAALDGEGKISERLDLLWKLLLNWIEEVRKADFVMIACHSQGVPVAIMLVAKLIHFGCISSARVGICAMAGVSMGPFPEFKSRWISGSAGELFEFADPKSKVSTDYVAALDDVLRFGVRLTYIGSIDDQLVSMESSIFAPISHPHIFRAVSVDSRLQAPSFISHLVAFALKLRNLGVEDHGLIRELSGPLAGSLYTGEGHSRLYEDGAIYDLALAFALETSSMPGVPLIRRNVDPANGGNPYILPFAMRGILEEDFVKSDLQHEASQLLQQFDDWKPQTKALKDVKFRLEGIRSKL